MSSPVFGYRPSGNYKVIPSGHPVCVVANYNAAGDFKPVSFGCEVNGMRFRYNIKAINKFKDGPGFRTFECTYVSLGLEKPIPLKFCFESCQWTVG